MVKPERQQDDPEKSHREHYEHREHHEKSGAHKLYNFFNVPGNGRKTWVNILLYVAERFGLPTFFSMVLIVLISYASRSIYNDIFLPISEKHLEFVSAVQKTLEQQEDTLKEISETNASSKDLLEKDLKLSERDYQLSEKNYKLSEKNSKVLEKIGEELKDTKKSPSPPNP